MTFQSSPQVFLAAWLTAATGAWPAVAETMDELYAKAKPESQLVLYSGGPVAPYESRTL
jgi:hypothetical protein